MLQAVFDRETSTDITSTVMLRERGLFEESYLSSTSYQDIQGSYTVQLQVYLREIGHLELLEEI
jgi:hypothetical protein